MLRYLSGPTYSSSTKYGAASKEARRATFTEGAACALSTWKRSDEESTTHSLHGRVENLIFRYLTGE
jgi:hypothetical protein